MVKQIIVMRKDLGMRRGKSVAQGAHASMKAILDIMQTYNVGGLKPSGDTVKSLHLRKDSPLEQWINGIFTKIVVYVKSEEELLEVYNKAREKGIICSLIEDIGNTEFHGVPTKTCCAIGPDTSEKIDEITGHLPLL